MHEMTQIDLADEEGQRVAVLSGSLDVFTSSMLSARVLAGLPDDAHDLVLDLHALEFVDSAGISALARLRSAGRSRAIDVRGHIGDDCALHETVQSVVRRVLPCD